MAKPVNATLIEPTPFGTVGIVWHDRNGSPAIVRVVLSAPGRPAAVRLVERFPEAGRASCAEIDAVAERIGAFLAGEDIPFSLSIVDWAGCSAFQQSVLLAEYGIPRGLVSTYGLIAGAVGRPSGARAVGGALSGNPFPLLIPCHRAVRSDGRLGGFQGGLAMKRALLAYEGVEVDAAGRVIRPRLHYAGVTKP